MLLKLAGRTLDLTQPRVMGVLNVTPDSFSDGGAYPSVETAVAQALRMVEEGADIIDVGGESTRPRASPITEQQELDRVIPVIEAVRRRSDVVISADTMKPGVMRAACAAGAQLINDVMALSAPGALQTVADTGAGVVLMHMRGEPRTMQLDPVYGDVVADVRMYLSERVQVCRGAGIASDRIVVDPGIGFGKTLRHNLQLLANLRTLAVDGCPLLIGVSRKSMFGALLGRPVEQRLPASLAAASLAVWQGAAIVRAHDVRATADAVRVAQALKQAVAGPGGKA